MRRTDILVVGGGLAGSSAAAMLGRKDIETILVDPRETYPEDFRCEKLDGTQVAILKKTGLADGVLATATHDSDVWVARYGRLVEKRPSDQLGIRYDTLVNTVRFAIPRNVEVVHAKAVAVETDGHCQLATLSNGETISARLMVMASGLNLGFGNGLGLTREILSADHSISIGFDLAPTNRAAFDFPALTYWPERPSDRVAYLTLFPIGSAMRANLMIYRDKHDPWLRRMRSAPRDALREVMPRLENFLGDYAVVGPVKIRPADLYATRNYRRDGIVLVGDAFATSCPAAGTGTNKVFNDVERLVNHHIPAWLATPGMSAEKIVAFYEDPEKRAVDAHSFAKAYALRSLSVDTDFVWRARRGARFAVGMGRNTLRSAIGGLSPILARALRPSEGGAFSA